MNPNYGWLDRPFEAARVTALLFGRMLAQDIQADQTKDVVLTDFTSKIVAELPAGPQGIGDCVSWGYGNGTNIIQCTQMLNIVKEQAAPDFEKLMVGEKEFSELEIVQDMGFEYREIATESIYGFSRCEVGKQWNSYQDGSVGAWAAKAMEQYGCLSRQTVGAYDPKRAKEWGAKGVPDQFEPEARINVVKACTPVKSFLQAAGLIQGGHPVVVCSNQGFSLNRDSQGFCRAEGTWYHCMLFMGVRWGRPGLLCMQSWGKKNPNGPLVMNMPSNTFWVEQRTCDYMLKQNDSYAPSWFNGYKSNFDWSF